MSEALILLLSVAVLAFVAGLVLADRRARAGISQMQAFLEGWEEGERWGAAHARSSSDTWRSRLGARSRFLPVLTRLEERRREYVGLRQLSTATSRRLQKLMDAISEEVLIYDPTGQLLFASFEIQATIRRALTGGDGAGDPSLRQPGLTQASSPAQAAVAENASPWQGEVVGDLSLPQIGGFLDAHSNLPELRREWQTGADEPQCRELTIEFGEERRRFFAAPHVIEEAVRGDMGLVVVLTHMKVLDQIRSDALRRVALQHLILAGELLAHRMRNPLNSIVLVVELLRRAEARSPQAPVTGYLRTIQDEVARLESTLQRFLELLQHREHRAESTDLVAVIETVWELLHPLARAADVRMRQELHLTSALVWADPLEVTRAVLVPCLAALRAGLRGGEIRLRLDRDQRKHVLLLECGVLPTDVMEMGVAEELMERNGGDLLVDLTSPGRLTYRLPAMRDGRVEEARGEHRGTASVESTAGANPPVTKGRE